MGMIRGGIGYEFDKSGKFATVKLYPYESDGIEMEILTSKAKDIIIRIDLNTCQVCYASRKCYYVQEGDVLVC